MPTNGIRGQKPSRQGIDNRYGRGNVSPPFPDIHAKGRGQKISPPIQDELAITSWTRTENYLSGRHPYDISKGRDAIAYARYARHPIVSEALDRIIYQVFLAKMVLTPVNDYSKNADFEQLDQDIIARVEAVLGGIKNETFNNVLKSLLRNAMIYGYSIAEMVWDKNEAGVWDLKALKPRPSYNFSFEVLGNDDLKSLIYDAMGKYIRDKELENFVIGTWPYLEHGNYYGTSILNSVTYELDQLELLEKMRMTGATQSVKRKMVVHINAAGKSKEANAQILAELKTFSSGADFIQVPAIADREGKLVELYKFDILDDQPSHTALEQITEAIAELKRDIKRSLGVSDNLGSTTTENTSFAKDSNIEYTIFSATISGVVNWIESLCNRQIIPEIIKYNFPALPDGYKIPVYKVEEVEEEYAISRVEFYKQAIDAGILNPKEAHIREGIRVPPEESLPTNPEESPELSLLKGGKASA